MPVSRKISLFGKLQRGRSPSFELFQLEMYGLHLTGILRLVWIIRNKTSSLFSAKSQYCLKSASYEYIKCFIGEKQNLFPLRFRQYIRKPLPRKRYSTTNSSILMMSSSVYLLYIGIKWFLNKNGSSGS